MSSIDVIPDSRLNATFTPKGSVWKDGMWWQPLFCANCGMRCGIVPEEGMDFAFYLCPKCFEAHGTIAGTYAMPDDAYNARLRELQLEKHGRMLTPVELLIALDDVNNPLSRLGRERRSIITQGV